MKAVIDIGTNTFHLNIANVLPNNQIDFVYKTYKIKSTSAFVVLPSQTTIAHEQTRQLYQRPVDNRRW